MVFIDGKTHGRHDHWQGETADRVSEGNVRISFSPIGHSTYTLINIPKGLM